MEEKKTTEQLVEEIKRLLRELPRDDDRKKVFGEFCVHCGCCDPDCQCWNDE